MDLQRQANLYRKELFEKFVEVGQGHPGSTFSMIEIATTLYHGGYVGKEDKVLVSKGHATVTLYPILRDMNILPMCTQSSQRVNCMKVQHGKDCCSLHIVS